MLPVVFVAVVGSLAGYALLRPAPPEPSKSLSWQVRSFDGLGPADQAIHGALLLASEETIWFNNDTGGINAYDSVALRNRSLVRDGSLWCCRFSALRCASRCA